MRSFDFAPLYRASIGFDQIADLLDRVSTHQGGQSSYPPYNIEKTEEDGYRISIAAAGFSEADLEIEVKENTLNVSAQKPKAEDKRTYLHRGISTRAFERQFHLADHVRAVGASYEDGMLHIELICEVPEALKPRRIQIQSKSPLQVEASPA
jgi:molecular chaperone IbpA